MKFLNTSRMIDYKIIELPKNCYKVLPPKRLQVALTLIGIAVTAILWAIE